MKRIITINLGGRVLPIEEPAYEQLQQYVASLRNYFSKEDVELIIIGDPKNWDNSDTHATPLVEKFIKELAKLNHNLYYWIETIFNDEKNFSLKIK